MEISLVESGRVKRFFKHHGTGRVTMTQSKPREGIRAVKSPGFGEFEPPPSPPQARIRAIFLCAKNDLPQARGRELAKKFDETR